MTKLFKFALPLSIAFAAVVPQVAVAQEAAAIVDAASYAGKTLYGPKGERIGAIYKVTSAGVPQLIVDGKIRNIPAETLSVVDGKLTTSLTKKDLRR